VLIEEGMKVETGQVLARIDSSNVAQLALVRKATGGRAKFPNETKVRLESRT
jgi:multidrug efflux pump subunit AcrA (membrane-fusion protein)